MLCYNTSTVKVRNTTLDVKEIMIMWCFEIMNKETKERDLVFGYSWKDAVRRCNINEDEWTVLRQDYED